MPDPISIEQQLHAFRSDFDALRREMAKIIVGQEDVVGAAVRAAIAGGHVLFEGVPGLGKTVLVQALAEVMQLSFQRIQFTPDLMPTDLIGTHVVMENAQGRRTFEFQQGPLFANVILADQINRGMPKTQAALLEAMEGQSISVSTETFQLPKPFVVMATQNPLEMEGTFPLPEPEIDRFFCKLLLSPPSVEELAAIVQRTTEGEPPIVAQVVDGRRVLEMRQIARNVHLADDLRRWIATLAAATQPGSPQAPQSVNRYVRYGASPRGAQALALAAKVRAASEGRGTVAADDVRAAAHAALRHRMILNFEGQAEGIATDRLIDDILAAPVAL